MIVDLEPRQSVMHQKPTPLSTSAKINIPSTETVNNFASSVRNPVLDSDECNYDNPGGEEIMRAPEPILLGRWKSNYILREKIWHTHVLIITKTNVIVLCFLTSPGVREQSIVNQDLVRSSNVSKAGCGTQLDASTYSNFDRTKMLASTPTKETRSPAKKRNTSGPVYSKDMFMITTKIWFIQKGYYLIFLFVQAPGKQIRVLELQREK